MGRKQKVRQDRRTAKIKEQLELEYQSALEIRVMEQNRGGFVFLFPLFIFGFSLSLHFLFYPENTTNAICVSVLIALIALVEVKKILRSKMYIANDRTGTDLQDFPKSDSLLQAFKLFKEGNRNQAIDRYMDGATEYGCVHSMYMLGVIDRDGGSILKGKFVHLSQPWFIEGAIRGSASVTADLVEVYLVYQLGNIKALTMYWIKMKCQYLEWSGGSQIVRKSEMKTIKGEITRSCAVCLKTDTETLTLQQCMGCSMYCYCGEDCQRTHWDAPKHNHRAECKQLKILNKYHKPFAKEIRDASIRGDIVIPALEKLRYKLGLSRPAKDYDQLQNINTHEGKPITPRNHIVARNDGTVWIGSFPNYTATTTATTRRTKTG